MSSRLIRPHRFWRILACHRVMQQSVMSAASVRAVPDIQTRKSMVTWPAHTACPALRIRVSALRRDQVELLLCLIQAEADALLVE
ncbi:MAG: hypothetical protein K0S99_292 [Thermomicrobiales bacterium]|nr:hypothetical protein [Thermomicrobiales bacterium]